MNGLSTLVTRLALSTRLSIIDLFAFGFLLYFATIGHHSFHYCFVNLVLRISMARPTGRRPAHCKTTMANNTIKKKRHQLSLLAKHRQNNYTHAQKRHSVSWYRVESCNMNFHAHASKYNYFLHTSMLALITGLVDKKSCRGRDLWPRNFHSSLSNELFFSFAQKRHSNKTALKCVKHSK